MTRDGSRLLVVNRDTGTRTHATFRDLAGLLRPRSLVVLNDTRVISARLRGRKPTGGALEILLVRPCAEPVVSAAAWEETWDVLAKNLARLPPGSRLDFGGGLDAVLVARGDKGQARIRFSANNGRGLVDVAESIGTIPLPPYIESARRRGVVPAPVDVTTPEDRLRYQTVFARAPGAVAAPTAGLHFTPELLSLLPTLGHEVAHVTLHVGPGTFRPVEVEDPDLHQVDQERYELSEPAAIAIRTARAEGRPIVAVGTTVVRVLETLATKGDVLPGTGTTELFLRPGSTFRWVTDLVTNFHLPRSSLLMLVAAFAGQDRVMAAYREAVTAGYRFYSYGDAMFIRPDSSRPAL